MVLRLSGLVAPPGMRFDESDALALAIAGLSQVDRPTRGYAARPATGRRISPVLQAVLARRR
jgi:hypothetical protein